jgi:hypothetical protein
VETTANASIGDSRMRLCANRAQLSHPRDTTRNPRTAEWLSSLLMMQSRIAMS